MAIASFGTIKTIKTLSRKVAIIRIMGNAVAVSSIIIGLIVARRTILFIVILKVILQGLLQAEILVVFMALWIRQEELNG